MSTITFPASATPAGDVHCLSWLIISDNSLELDHSFTVNADDFPSPSGITVTGGPVRININDNEGL